MRVRRHAPTKRKETSTPQRSRRSRFWRRFVRDIAIVAAVAVLGYVISAVWISPTSLFTRGAHSTPRVLGMTEADARKELEGTTLRGRVVATRAHPTARAGVVIWQDPPPGVVLLPNSVVTLTVSAGVSPASVPDVAGLDTATARRILTAAGLTVGNVVTVSAGAEPGIVVTTQPAIGASRPRGGSVGLVISRGLEGNP